MTNQPKKDPGRNSRAGSDPRVRAEFSDQLTEFLASWVRGGPTAPGLKHEDLALGLIDALMQVKRQVPDGMGIAVLQTAAYELMERINADINGRTVGESSAKAERPGATTHSNSPARIEPAVEPVDTSEILEALDTSSWNRESPLHRLGYTVAENGRTAAWRHAVLMQAFISKQLPGVTAAQERDWGLSSSAQRLYAISKFIAWMVSFQGSGKPSARKKWIEDLTWLKENFYRPGLRFDWPVTPEAAGAKAPATRRTPNAAFMATLQPSAELAAVVGSAPLPRTEVVSRLWSYIKTNKLQDRLNQRMINADATLAKVFGKNQVSMFEMADLIGKHLR